MASICFILDYIFIVKGKAMSADALTDRARELLDALKAADDWTSRAELARATRKNRLSPHDIDLLERMEKDGLIESRQRKSKTPIGTAFDYRAKHP
jgi:predicted transcriptional regulator